MATATLFDRWWTIALRGAAAIVFGILTLIAPGAGLLALVVVFGAYALVDGAFNVAFAFRRHRHWGALLAEGIVGIAVGVLTFLWPGITAVALLLLIAVWAIVTGAAEIAAAIRLRRVIRGEWLMAVAGILSIAFGILLFAFPGAGALALAFWIAAYAIVFGVLLVALGFRLRALATRPGAHLPEGGVRSPA